MAHRKKNRNVGIIGIGQTKHSSHREDVNQPEMIHEAVSLALKDAGLTMKDIDCVVHGNMELFEMVHQPDLWHVLGTGAYGKDCIRITTGGTVGGTINMRVGQPGGIGDVRYRHGHRLREAAGRPHHGRHHQHGGPPLVPQDTGRGPHRSCGL